MSSSSSLSSDVPSNPIFSPNFIPDTPSFEDLQRMYKDLKEQKTLLQQEKNEFFDSKSTAEKVKNNTGGMSKNSFQNYSSSIGLNSYGSMNQIAQVKLSAPPA